MASAGYNEIRISVPWGHIAGRWYGDQLQHPILALHGWLDNCGSFAKLAPLLATQNAVLCIDLPGHGHSTHLPVGVIYHDMEFVRCIARIRDIYNWDKVKLMGHSMGANAVFLYAALYPQRVDMIIGLDLITHAPFTTQAVPNLINVTIERAVQDNERLVASDNMQEPPTYTYAECVQLLYEATDKSVALENCKYLLERNITKSQKYPNKYYFSRDGRVKLLFDQNPSEELSRTMALRIAKAKIPHLLVKGAATKNVSALMNLNADLMQQNNTNFEQHLVAGGTHHLHLNNATEVAKIINKFLQKHDKVDAKIQEIQTQIDQSEENDLDKSKSKLKSKL